LPNRREKQSQYADRGRKIKGRNGRGDNRRHGRDDGLGKRYERE